MIIFLTPPSITVTSSVLYEHFFFSGRADQQAFLHIGPGNHRALSLNSATSYFTLVCTVQLVKQKRKAEKCSSPAFQVCMCGILW